MKYCPTCKQDLPLSRFHKNRSAADGVNGYCKECRCAQAREWAAANKDKISARNRRTRLENPEKVRKCAWASVLKRKYGLTVAGLALLKEQQGNACAICTLTGPLVVDHCHATGKVRRLLCQKCNRGLGHFNDNPDLLVKSAEYIRKHREAA